MIENEAEVSRLFSAIRMGAFEDVRNMISSGTSVNVRGIDQSTPLMVAALHALPQTTDLILSLGANISDRNASGNTALHLVAGNDFSDLSDADYVCDTTRVLLDAGAAVDARNDVGDTPLLCIAKSAGRQASSNYFDPEAAGLDLLPVVSLLLERGADPLARNHEGRNAREIFALHMLDNHCNPVSGAACIALLDQARLRHDTTPTLSGRHSIRRF